MLLSVHDSVSTKHSVGMGWDVKDKKLGYRIAESDIELQRCRLEVGKLHSLRCSVIMGSTWLMAYGISFQDNVLHYSIGNSN